MWFLRTQFAIFLLLRYREAGLNKNAVMPIEWSQQLRILHQACTHGL
jgi:hypothetical protein